VTSPDYAAPTKPKGGNQKRTAATRAAKVDGEMQVDLHLSSV